LPRRPATRGTRRLHTDAGLCGDARHQPGHAQLPYDAVKDFTAIGMIGATPNAGGQCQPAGQDGEGIHRLHEEEGQVSYGSAGQGSLTHLTMELFKQQIDFMVHIPHRAWRRPSPT
jgi:tripartite-type tricarboxylate transporter receptor subunit TctC